MVSVTDRKTRWKVKSIEDLNIINQFDLMDGYLKMLHPKTSEYLFFSSMHRIFIRIDHMLGHKVSQISKDWNFFQVIFLHSGVKVELNNSKIPWRLQKELWVKGEIKKENRNYFKINDSEHITYQNVWNVAKSVFRGNNH